MTPVTLIVFCEGETVQRIVTQVLTPHFAVFPKGQLLKLGTGRT